MMEPNEGIKLSCDQYNSFLRLLGMVKKKAGEGASSICLKILLNDCAGRRGALFRGDPAKLNDTLSTPWGIVLRPVFEYISQIVLLGGRWFKKTVKP